VHGFVNAAPEPLHQQVDGHGGRYRERHNDCVHQPVSAAKISSLAQASHRSFLFNSAQISAFDPPRVGIRRALGYFPGVSMPSFELPRAAVAVEVPRHVRLQIVSPAAEPPVGDGWLHRAADPAALKTSSFWPPRSSGLPESGATSIGIRAMGGTAVIRNIIAHFAVWVLAFCAVLTLPVVLIFGVPIAIGLGADLVQAPQVAALLIPPLGVYLTLRSK
jgi:hypothetical protein